MTGQGRRATPVDGARWVIKGELLDALTKFRAQFIIYTLKPL